MITSTVPAWLKTLIAPVVDNPTVTWFAIGGLDAGQLRFDVCPRSASAGNTARKLDAVGLSIVTFAVIAVAADGMTQSPFVPTTARVAVSSDPIGVILVPTVEPGRVSAKRHGTIDTNADAEGATANTF